MKKLITIVAIFFLAGCGGGDSGTQPTTTPAPAPAPAPSPTPAPPAGITISGKLTSAGGYFLNQNGYWDRVVLFCQHPIGLPNQWGCSGPTGGHIQPEIVTADANGNYSFTEVKPSAYYAAVKEPIPSGYTWKVVPYGCSQYSYAQVQDINLPLITFLTCSPADRIFDLTASITGINFFQWLTP
jgi:hypothetical protein